MIRIDFINRTDGYVEFKMDIDTDTNSITIAKMVKAILDNSDIGYIYVDGIEIEVYANHAITGVEVVRAWDFCRITKRELLKAAEDGTLARKLNEMYKQDKI